MLHWRRNVFCTQDTHQCALLSSNPPLLPNVTHTLSLLFPLKDASSADIRKAYRRLSLVLHPDKNKDENAETQFRQVSHALPGNLHATAL